MSIPTILGIRIRTAPKRTVRKDVFDPARFNEVDCEGVTDEMNGCMDLMSLMASDHVKGKKESATFSFELDRFIDTYAYYLAGQQVKFAEARVAIISNELGLPDSEMRLAHTQKTGYSAADLVEEMRISAEIIKKIAGTDVAETAIGAAIKYVHLGFDDSLKRAREEGTTTHDPLAKGEKQERKRG